MASETIATPAWQDSFAKRIASKLTYPLFFLLNRPSMAWFGKAVYDFALRCNGIAITFHGAHGLTAAEDHFLTKIASKLQRSVLLDVGANVGTYCNALARIAPGSVIHAFEPHPKTFKLLMGRATSGIRLVNKAVSAQAGATELYDFAAADGSTQASLSADTIRYFGGRPVSHRIECTTIDQFMAETEIDRVALLKIDTEGHDLDVLKGAAKALAERRIDLVQFEFIPANIVTRATMRDFFEALRGYDIFRLCLNGDLLPLLYDVKRCEIFVTQILIAKLRQ